MLTGSQTLREQGLLEAHFPLVGEPGSSHLWPESANMLSRKAHAVCAQCKKPRYTRRAGITPAGGRLAPQRVAGSWAVWHGCTGFFGRAPRPEIAVALAKKGSSARDCIPDTKHTTITQITLSPEPPQRLAWGHPKLPPMSVCHDASCHRTSCLLPPISLLLPPFSCYHLPDRLARGLASGARTLRFSALVPPAR